MGIEIGNAGGEFSLTQEGNDITFIAVSSTVLYLYYTCVIPVLYLCYTCTIPVLYLYYTYILPVLYVYDFCILVVNVMTVMS